MNVLGRMLGQVFGEAGGMVLRVLGGALVLALLSMLLTGTDMFGALGGMIAQALPWLVLAALAPAVGFVLWRLGQIVGWRAGRGEVCGRCGGLAVARIWRPDAPLRCMACGTRKRRRDEMVMLKKEG